MAALFCILLAGLSFFCFFCSINHKITSMRKIFIAMLAAWWAALQAVAIQAVTDKMSAYAREAAAMSKTKKKAAPGEGQMLMTAFVSIDTTAADSILAAYWQPTVAVSTTGVKTFTS